VAQVAGGALGTALAVVLYPAQRARSAAAEPARLAG
jgi:hypothetical protein